MLNAKRQSAREITLFIICFFAVWALRATYFYAIDESITSDALRTVYSSAVKLLFWAAPVFGFAYWIRHSSPLRYLGLSAVPSARQWLWALVIIGLFLGTIVGLEVTVGRKILSFSSFSSSITLPGVLITIVSPLIEEILFRGLLLKELSSHLPRWGANLLASLLFAGIHLPFWLSHGGLSGVVLANTASVLIFSLVAGWLYLKTFSIWPSSLAHIANNCVAALLVISP